MKTKPKSPDMVEASRKWRQETSARLDAMSIEARLEYLEGFRKAEKSTREPLASRVREKPADGGKIPINRG
jgi:hypothetical protein